MKNKRSVAYLLLFIVFGGLAYSCQNRPKEVLNRKQMEQLMYDVYVAEATMENDYHNFDTPEKKEAYINKIFKTHKTTQVQWDTSLSWYSDRIDIYLKMNDSVKARLQRARQGVDAMVAQLNQLNQTDPSLLPPSYIPSHYSFAMADPKKGFRFRLDSAEISSKFTGDDYLFSFSTIGIPASFSPTITSLFTLVYSDTTLYHFQNIRENKTYEFPASRFFSGDTITQISGFVHFQDSIGTTPHIQLYNISFGEPDSLSFETDTLKVPPDTLGGDTLTTDSLKLLSPDSLRLQESDSPNPHEPDSVNP